MNIITLLNGIAVGVFGMLLSASFCNIVWNRRKKLLMSGSMIALLLVQGLIYYLLEPEAVRYLYPVITHFPLVLVLSFLTGKYFRPFVSVFTAYLCCQLRRWLALVLTAAMAGDSMTQGSIELIITIPLLYILLKVVSPAVRSIFLDSISVQSQFCLIPVVYYVFDYMTQIYTDLLTQGNPVIVEFMSFVCSAAYLVFVFQTSEEKWKRNQLEQTQDSLNLQISQAVREIETLRESQQKTREYRHDLRHHMQYLSSCIENGKLENAQDYIKEICSQIEANKVIIFCENEAANLIFSAFVARAEENKIPINIEARISKNIHVAESDLCVLLSNALENALHACQRMKENGKNVNIQVSAFEKNDKLFFQFVNSCDSRITFVRGIPITEQVDHGIGVRSICALVERYEGIYTFEVDEGKFVLRVSL